MTITWKTCFRVGLSAFLLYLAVSYWTGLAGLLATLVSAALPLLLGCAAAYPLNLIMNFYDRKLLHKLEGKAKKLRRPAGILLALCSFAAVCALVFWLIAPQLVACVQMLLAELPGAISDLVNWLGDQHLLTEETWRSLANIDWRSRLTSLISTLLSGVGTVVGTITNLLGSIISLVTTAVLALIFALYILSDKERLGSQIRRVVERWMPEKWSGQLWHVLDTADDCMHRYLVGQCTEAIILGALCALGMWLLRLPYAVMIGALVAFTALVPIVGAFLGGGIGAFLIMTESLSQAVIFVIFLVLLQQLEENLIYPRVVGASIGLPGIWVLAAITLGGGVLGIMGMFLAVPAAATAYRLLREAVNTPPKKPKQLKME